MIDAMRSTIPMVPVTSERISFRRFLQISEKDRAEIKSVSIQAPRLGKRGFGGVVVTYRAPRFVRAHSGA